MVGLIAHEWIAPHGGSENVAEAMGRAFPDADVATLWNDAPGRFSRHSIRESWLARTPLRHNKAASLPFMSRAWRAVPTSKYDFILASSHVFAHHVGGLGGPDKFVYVHTPARTIWAPEQDSRGANGLVRAVSPYYRSLDRRFVDPMASYAANSRYIQARIKATWSRDSTVIYPPVDVRGIRMARGELTEAERAIVGSLPDTFVLGASRFVRYKRLDLVIASGAVAGIPVVLAGSGPLKDELEGLAAEARVPVTFVDKPSNELLHELYRRAQVFVFPAVEDFGIMPVEAMAAGTPVVTYREGGASESVELVGGGAVAQSLDPRRVASAIEQAVGLDVAGVPDRVEAQFGEEAFRARLSVWTGREIAYNDH